VLSPVAARLESPTELCVTAPSFPGLPIRIETLILAGAAGGAVAVAGESLVEPAALIACAGAGGGGTGVGCVAGVVTTGVAVVAVGVLTVGVVATGVGTGVDTVVVGTVGAVGTTTVGAVGMVTVSAWAERGTASAVAAAATAPAAATVNNECLVALPSDDCSYEVNTHLAFAWIKSRRKILDAAMYGHP
jgi:hypothetical protein